MSRPEVILRGPVTLVLPASRHGEIELKMNIEKSEISVSDVLQTIYRFYQEPVTTEQLTAMDRELDDPLGYVERALKKAKTGKRVKRIELMGDLKHFEGLSREADGSYAVELGS